MKPLCFILMPYRTKPDPTGGRDIDFDKIYRTAIKPGIEDAGLEPIRGDHEKTGGIIHKPMFERLLLCDFAVADLTIASANVLYELGVRHTARPSTTVTLYAEHQPIPFDIGFLRSIPYQLGANNAFDEDVADQLRADLCERLIDLREYAAKEDLVDSPIFQLVGEWKPPEIARLKTDTFREVLNYNQGIKEELTKARTLGQKKETRNEAKELLGKVRSEIAELDQVESGTVIDILLSFRALEDWQAMIDLHAEMPKVLQEQILVQEQLAFALNRLAGETGDADLRRQALEILLAVESRQGASAETCGLIGRIHKDDWLATIEAGAEFEAPAHLNKAIDAYTKGFMADQRDAYPGINAVTLLDLKGDEESLKQRDKLLPVVQFAVERRTDNTNVDYWDHATLLELAVISGDDAKAGEHIGNALAAIRESWEPETTVNNLQMIADARASRGEESGMLQKIIDALTSKREGMLATQD